MKAQNPLVRETQHFLLFAALLMLSTASVFAQKPSVITVPKSQYVALGLNARFTGAASGTSPLFYQWRFRGTNLPGATTTALDLTNASPELAGNYQFVVTNSLGAATSAVAVLSVGPVANWGYNKLYSSVTNIPLDVGNRPVRAVAAAGDFSGALFQDGAVRIWGRSANGETNVPGDLTNAIALAICDNGASVALRSDGRVTAWGNPASGVLNVPAEVTNVVDIVAGSGYVLALRADGTVRGWGLAGSGQTNVPAGLAEVALIRGSKNLAAAVRSNGTVVVWGNGNGARVQIPAGLMVIDLKLGDSSCLGLKLDGNAECWAYRSGSFSYYPITVPLAVSNVVQVATGSAHYVALKDDSSVVAWGSNTSGETNVPAGLSEVSGIAAGQSVTFAFRSNGSLAAWGSSVAAQTTIPTNLTQVFQVGFGNGQVVALRGTGAPLFLVQPSSQTGWESEGLKLFGGAIGEGSLSYQWQKDGTDLPGATAASLSLPSLALENAGAYQLIVSNYLGAVTSRVAIVSVRPQLSIAAWGNNGRSLCNIPAGSEKTFAITGGGGFAVALREGAIPQSWGWSAIGSKMPTNITTLKTISAGVQHVIALNENGAAVGWGVPLSPFETAVTNTSGLPTLSAVSAGSGHNLGLLLNGTVRQWGDSSSLYFIGAVPAGLSNVKAVAAGDNFNVVLLSNSTVVAWGTSHQGQTNVPAGLSDVIAIACGAQHALALKNDGNVVAWGDNSRGQTNVPPDATNVVAIASASTGYHSLALRADGTVVAWGDNTFEESTVPSGLTNVVEIGVSGLTSFAVVSRSAPSVNLPPRSQSGPPGSTLLLTASASGSPPLSYQWQLDGTNIPGATSNSLLLPDLRSRNLGCYSAVVTNYIGSVTSRCAQVGFGNVMSWGNNPFEQNTIPFGLSNAVGVIAGFGWNGALLPDGCIISWGHWRDQPPTGLPPLKTVVTGPSLNLGLTFEGTLVSWGVANALRPPPGLSNIVGIAVGESHGLALREDGLLLGWSTPPIGPDYGQGSLPDGLSNVIAVAAGDRHSLALKADGTIQSWGMVTNVPPGLTNVIAIAATKDSSLALRSDGTVTYWGLYAPTQPPADLTNAVSIAVGYSDAGAVRQDGFLVMWGSDSLTNFPPWANDLVAASACWDTAMALQGDGSPHITVQPSPRWAAPGGSVQFVVMAASKLPLSYQWQFKGQDLVGETNSTLKLSNLRLANAGEYRCLVTNTLGGVWTSTARLRITPEPITFDSSPDALSAGPEGFKMRLRGLAEAGAVILYRSTNLVNWVPIATNPPTLGVSDFTDSEATNGTPAFYRATEQR
jgi:alpha-tubulin suppressor-like RCC1 family protein